MWLSACSPYYQNVEMVSFESRPPCCLVLLVRFHLYGREPKILLRSVFEILQLSTQRAESCVLQLEM